MPQTLGFMSADQLCCRTLPKNYDLEEVLKGPKLPKQIKIRSSQTWLLFAIFMEALFCALLRSFAPFCPLLRSFAPFCPLLRSLELICALLRAFACFCVRPRLERPRLGTADKIGQKLLHSRFRGSGVNIGQIAAKTCILTYFFTSSRPTFDRPIFVLF